MSYILYVLLPDNNIDRYRNISRMNVPINKQFEYTRTKTFLDLMQQRVADNVTVSESRKCLSSLAIIPLLASYDTLDDGSDPPLGLCVDFERSFRSHYIDFA